MKRLDELIAALCPDGVDWKPLGELCRRRKGTPITAGQMRRLAVVNGAVRVFAAGETTADLPAKSIPARDVISEPGIIVKARGYVGFEYCTKPFTHKNELWSYTAKDKSLDLKYVYYYLVTQTIKLQYVARSKSVKLPQLSTGDTDDLAVPLPPLTIQKEIVRILDGFTGLIDTLEAELAARRKQFGQYREKLLTYGDEVKRLSLEEIGTSFVRGSGIKRDELTDGGVPCVRYGEIYTTYNISFEKCRSHTTVEVAERGKRVEYGDILFAITGESVDEIAKSCAYIGNEKCYAGGDIVIMKHNHDPKYLSYVLSTAEVQAQKSRGKIKSKVVHSTVSALKKIVIPIPSIIEQKRIVAILDKSTGLIDTIEDEIAARKKQYEYYREKLLTFKRKETA